MGSFVGVVITALVVTNYLPASPQSTTLSFQELALYSGPASVHSYTVTCSGDSLFTLYAQNPTPNPISILSVTISGNGVVNATAYVAVSNNSCLTLSEAGVSVPAGSDYQLIGYVSAPLAPAAAYKCVVLFSNGQVLNQSLIAEFTASS